jgi:hypothetical protein
MILMGYGGVTFAILLSGLLGMENLVGREGAAASGFIYFHVVALLFLLIGARHLFSLPVELKANWLFQLTEGEGRRAWMRAVDRFLLFWGALVMAAPLPLEIRWLGWRGLGETALACAWAYWHMTGLSRRGTSSPSLAPTFRERRRSGFWPCSSLPW